MLWIFFYECKDFFFCHTIWGIVYVDGSNIVTNNFAILYIAICPYCESFFSVI